MADDVDDFEPDEEPIAAPDGPAVAFPDPSSPPVPPIGDSVRLIAELRRGDDEARDLAYRRVFTGPLGREVLADIQRQAGFGVVRGTQPADQANYVNGQMDLALEIASTAGFDQASIAVMLLSGILEGETYE